VWPELDEPVTVWIRLAAGADSGASSEAAVAADVGRFLRPGRTRFGATRHGIGRLSAIFWDVGPRWLR
jgi:hypothetical protein